VIKDVPKLFTTNVEDKKEAYFSSLIASILFAWCIVPPRE